MTLRILTTLIVLALVAGCASTRVESSGTRPAQPLCQAGKPAISAALYWGTQWRPDQKEPQLREAAALRGIEDFARHTACLAVAGIHRLPADLPPPVDDGLLRMAAKSTPPPERLVLIVVRELGPRLVIGLPTIVEGGTEVQLDVRVLNPGTGESLANMQTHWQNGGVFIIKGVKTLDSDMSAALNAALMQASAAAN